MKKNSIIVHGAKEHNLKNINVEIPRDKLTVITGLSGSVKSSLAFDTIYPAGQRRYVESLSSYALQFLGLTEKPDVEFIDALVGAVVNPNVGVSPSASVADAVNVNSSSSLMLDGRVGSESTGGAFELSDITTLTSSTYHPS